MSNKEGLKSNESAISIEEEVFSPEQLEDESIKLNESIKRETEEAINLASEIQSDPVSNYEEKQEAKSLSQQASMTRRDFLKKVALVTGAAVLTVPTVGKTENNNNDKIDETEIESDELSLVEQNRKLLIEGEYEAPSEVFRCLAEVISPDNMLEPVGGYFGRDYIDTKDEEKEFKERMKKLGYNDKEAQKYRKLFSGGSIVFNERILADEVFENVLAHERMHKEVENLPDDKKRILNEARDFILEDYRNKEREWGDLIDPLYKDGKIDYRIYGNMQAEFLEKNRPIMLSKDENMGGGVPLMEIMRNPREFYTYLMMGNLSTRVETFLESDFPEAYEIYIGLKDGIYHQIEESKKK